MAARGGEAATSELDDSWLDQFPEPVGRISSRAIRSDTGGGSQRLKQVPTAAELQGRDLRIVPEVLERGNPRRPFTHGWLAFEILLRQEGGRMPFDEYRKQLFHPAPEIRALAKQIPGVPNAFQDLVHIRHDIRCGRVVVE